MSVYSSQDQGLEPILLKILDNNNYYRGDQAGTAILLCLLNLLGLVSIMGARADQPAGQTLAEPARADQPAAGENLAEPARADTRQTQPPNPSEQMMSLLMNVMGHRQSPGPPAPGPGFNPALLLGLLGNQGGRPEQMALINMLAGMLAGQGGPAPGLFKGLAVPAPRANPFAGPAPAPSAAPHSGPVSASAATLHPGPAVCAPAGSTPAAKPGPGCHAGTAAAEALQSGSVPGSTRGSSDPASLPDAAGMTQLQSSPEVAEKKEQPPVPEVPFEKRGPRFKQPLRWDRRLV